MMSTQSFSFDKEKILLPTAYLPPVHYFVLMAKAGEVLIEQWETYPKQTYRNRCEIYSANGKIPLIIPVRKPNGNHTLTRDIVVSGHENWQTLHWRAIRTAYANSPFFLYYRDELKPFFESKAERLLDFNAALLQALVSLIGMDVRIELTAAYLHNPEDTADFRTMISPKKNFDLFALPGYYQTFEDRFGFIPGLSIVDLLFNLGPETAGYLTAAAKEL